MAGHDDVDRLSTRFSLILRSGLLAASRRMATRNISWFETREDALLVLARIAILRSFQEERLTPGSRPE
jgi:hypothetical protein